jgi:hypothetical protein
VTYHRAKEIFTEAVKLAPEDRGAYLDEHCGDDADLRAKVDSLLLNHSSTVKDQSPQRIAGEYQRDALDGAVDAVKYRLAFHFEIEKKAV